MRPPTSCNSIPYVQPAGPQFAVRYASAFPSLEIAGMVASPVKVICRRSVSVTPMALPAPIFPRASNAKSATTAMPATTPSAAAVRRFDHRRAAHDRRRSDVRLECARECARRREPVRRHFRQCFRDRALHTLGTVLRMTRSLVGASVRSLAMMTCFVAPVTGGSPAIIS